MDYYRSSYYTDDYSEYNSNYPLTHYSNSYYDSSLVQDSIAATAYSSYQSNDSQNFSYDSVPFFGAYDSVSNYPRIAYSVFTSSEPKHISYDPSSCYPVETRFIISYSVSEFNEPEFEEYDPTPYGGGYDLALTYGKPLPPSDEICYPRSSGAMTVPSEKEEVEEKQTEKPQIESKPTAAAAGTEQQQQQPHENELLESYPEQEIDENEPLESYPEEEVKEKHADEEYTWSGYGNESREVSQIPSGYGLEAMDLCEGLFGYWPCLSRYGQRWAGDCQQQQITDCGNCNNQWNGTADYLFGSTYPYGEKRDDGYAIYGYQSRYQQADSWYA